MLLVAAINLGGFMRHLVIASLLAFASVSSYSANSADVHLTYSQLHTVSDEGKHKHFVGAPKANCVDINGTHYNYCYAFCNATNNPIIVDLYTNLSTNTYTQYSVPANQLSGCPMVAANLPFPTKAYWVDKAASDVVTLSDFEPAIVNYARLGTNGSPIITQN
jgi:hypothetical protein